MSTKPGGLDWIGVDFAADFGPAAGAHFGYLHLIEVDHFLML